MPTKKNGRRIVKHKKMGFHAWQKMCTFWALKFCEHTILVPPPPLSKHRCDDRTLKLGRIDQTFSFNIPGLINSPGYLATKKQIMSELSGDRPRGSHGGSSLSIFSGDVGSSASGTSDLDHVNVEELSEGSLQETLEEAQRQIRRLTLETNMFQGTKLNQSEFSIIDLCAHAQFCLQFWTNQKSVLLTCARTLMFLLYFRLLWATNYRSIGF